ncbi:16S rRNA (cytosine(1402)-N(4))-methyltransferase RsmH [Kozakia baliensis]|uniref:16S rRNA (cytosine(1402)-N(4))-methyltransferase RsmH n=2 Tax=Kozakia baliensis TaxID=153496 RepID=UPI00087DDD5B|nr:16S rRNA (cytosine(1402)-N(4))-methyltransferase RsmH [Kozakia baliensis]AOX19625.1 16S rRNA (cytosine(1402)-N(4))-methyltransferase [Kozakia baliensis]
MNAVTLPENTNLEQHDPGHIPVMLAEVLSALAPRDGGRYLDGTFGGGGYARAILRAADCALWAIDRDPDALARGTQLAEAFRRPDGASRLHMLGGTFGDMQALTKDAAPFDGIVLDIGVSSYQIDQAERGFSFRNDGPLDMRMSQSGPSAADLVNDSREEELADIIYHYGEDRLSRRIARAIVQARTEAPIETTGRLAEIVRSVVRPDRSGIDPATRTFQALRIAVNDELGELQRAMEQAPALLAPGGKLVVVTFHSLEDRLVKRAMAQAAGRVSRPSRYEPMTDMREQSAFRLAHSKPIAASETEARTNPRARSAKLRTLIRLDPNASYRGQTL